MSAIVVMEKISSIRCLSGLYLDKVEFVFRSGESKSFGGPGGRPGTVLQLHDDENVSKLVLLQHFSEMTSEQYFGRILRVQTDKGNYELSGEHKGKQLIQTDITKRVLGEFVREDIAPSASESVVDVPPQENQRPRLPMQEQATDSSSGDMQPSDILDMHEIQEMRKIQGSRCDDYMHLCSHWSKKIANRLPSSQQDMKSPHECGASVARLFQEMQVHGLVEGISEVTKRGNIMCHFHISNAQETRAFHGTPLANMPAVMEHGIQSFVDKGRPDYGHIIFCFPEEGYEAAFGYSPWTWLKRLNMFLRVILRLHSNSIGPFPRGHGVNKQHFTKQAVVVGADVELCLAGRMAHGDGFFWTDARNVD